MDSIIRLHVFKCSGNTASVKMIFFISSPFILIPDEIHHFYPDEMNVELRRKNVFYVIFFQTQHSDSSCNTIPVKERKDL